MKDIVIARIMVTGTLCSIDSLLHDLSEEELDEMNDELAGIYEKYKAKTDK